MREKINKITVSTRITIPLRDMLEREAEQQGLSFCSYLEQLILERNTTKEDRTVVSENFAVLPSGSNSNSEQVNLLEEQLKSCKSAYLNYKKRSITRLKEAELELSDLESENYDLVASVKELGDKIQTLQQYDFESESFPFLEERYPDLSKATIIKTCLDCCAENEGHWLFLYRFSDYLKTEKSFTME